VRKLEPGFHERIWGVTDLSPWFPNLPEQAGSELVGEVWFETPEVPLLVKFLFTREKLSVQVHPDDDYARVHHNSPGKTEMWHVLAAEPGAKVAAGFRESVDKERVREAALTGEIENLLAWYSAVPGDTFFIPAGTVHAIGAGLTICEIQQRSNITYRLYDYGRGRELHLESGLEVSHLRPHQARTETATSCKHFAVEPLDVADSMTLPPAASPALLIVTGGAGSVNGQATRAGDVWLLGEESLHITGELHILRTLARKQ
jgi:mannose-6-phosphate isomerase